MKKLVLILLLVISAECISSIDANECHAAFDSLQEYENRTSYSSLFDFAKKIVQDIYTCFWSAVIINRGQLAQACIPRLITQDDFSKDCEGNTVDSSFTAGELIRLIAAIAAAVVLTFVPLVGIIAWLVIGALIIEAIVACMGTYALAPHEYVNGMLGRLSCDSMGNNIADNAVTEVDVPFFYKCNDNTIPQNKDYFYSGEEIKKDALEKEYGNMNGASTTYCVTGSEKFAVNNLKEQNPTPQVKNINHDAVKPGSIIIKKLGLKNLIFGRGTCDPQGKDSTYVFTVDDIRNGTQKDNMQAFYRLSSGKIQLCVATRTTVLPVIAGCTYVAPPIELFEGDSGFAGDTRCSYFLTSRQDLVSLGNSLLRGSTGGNYSSVGLFLRSDMHVMSTVIGCIKDILIKVVIGTKDDNGNSFLYKIQSSLKNIVKIVLVFYIAIIGIKLMSSPQVPQMGEIMMYVIKFVFVCVMGGIAGPEVWYPQEKSGLFKEGLYPLVMESMEGLVDGVLQATNDTSALKMCYQDMDGQNILSQRNIPADGGAMTPTLSPDGQANNVIKMTIWDFIDCKLVNYLNLNSCNYSMSGMVSMWLVSTCIFFPSAFIFGIITLIYVILLFMVMLRFVHLSVVSMFALTILVLVSPIMVCFILFEYTKQTFQSWFKMLLGYILYPAVIFTFVALMISTFDSIFYGTFDNTKCQDPNKCTIKEICIDKNGGRVNSLYCKFTETVGKDDALQDPTMCSMRSGHMINSLTEEYAIPSDSFPIITLTTARSITLDNLFEPMMKMLLFALLFHYLTGSVLSFLETLLGAYGISGMSPDYVNVGKKMLSTAAKSASGQATAAAKGVGKIFGKMG